MWYERIGYMCPECNQIYFFNKEEGYSTICPGCDVEMVFIEDKFVDSVKEKKKSERFQQALRNHVHCPYCNSVNTSKISPTDRAWSVGLFGLASRKLGKEWHCNQCDSYF